MENEKVAQRHEKFVKRLNAKKKHYIETSSVHGVSKICTDSKVESCFWLFVVLLGVILSSYGVATLISKYYRYEIYTSVSSKVTSRNVFPSITFCNERLMLARYYTYCGIFKNGDYPDKPCHSNVSPIREITNVVNSTKEWSNGIFHVTQCISWDNKICASDRYFKSLGKHHHTCITWNWNGDFFDAHGHTEIHIKLNKTAGYNFSKMVAFVHDPKLTELALTSRIYIQKSRVYELKVRKTEIKRLPYPFPSNCTNEHPYDIFPGKYSRNLCVDSIDYIAQFKACGDTFDYVKRYLPKDILRLHKRNVSMATAWKCMHMFSKRNDIMTDSCPVPCHEMEVNALSTSYGTEIRQRGNANNQGEPKETKYQVEIQHETFDSYKVIEEKQLYTWDQIAGGVGGFLGLIIGVSFVSVVELLAYLSLLVVEKCSRVYY